MAAIIMIRPWSNADAIRRWRKDGARRAWTARSRLRRRTRKFAKHQTAR
jgi:hypothetical protein